MVLVKCLRSGRRHRSRQPFVNVSLIGSYCRENPQVSLPFYFFQHRRHVGEFLDINAQTHGCSTLFTDQGGKTRNVENNLRTTSLIDNSVTGTAFLRTFPLFIDVRAFTD